MIYASTDAAFKMTWKRAKVHALIIASILGVWAFVLVVARL